MSMQNVNKRLTSYGIVSMGLYYAILTASKALGMDSSNSLYYGMFAIACIVLCHKYLITSYTLQEIIFDVFLVGMGLGCFLLSKDMTTLLLAITVVGLKDCDFREMAKVAFYVRAAITSIMISGSFLGIFDQGETAQVTTSFQDIVVYNFGYSTANNAYINIFLLVALCLYFGYERINWKWFGATCVLALLMYTFTNSRTGTLLFFAMWFFIVCEKFLLGKKVRPVFFGILRWMPLICGLFSLFATAIFEMDGSKATEYINRIFSGRLNITHQYYEALGVSFLPHKKAIMDSLRGIGFIDNAYMSVFFHNGLIVAVVIMALICIANGKLYKEKCYRELVFVATFSVYGMMEEFPLNPIVNPFIMLIALVVYKEFTIDGKTITGYAKKQIQPGKKQNVLIVHNYYRIAGGEDTVVANEKRMLEDNGHCVMTYERSNMELDSFNKLQKLCLPFTSIFSIKSYKEVRHLIEFYDIDVVHVHNTLSLVSPSVYYAAFKEGVLVVQTMHNFRLLCPGGSFYKENTGEHGSVCEECVSKGLKCSIKHGCYRKSKIQTTVSAAILLIHRVMGTYKRINFICLSQFNKTKLLLLNKKGKRLINPNKVFVKPNFAQDMSSLISDVKKDDYYVFVGRLEPLKGIRLLINAFILMPDKQLKIMGDGPLMEWAKNMVKEKNALNIELLGRKEVKEYASILAGAKALVTTSQCYETFGMSIAEAYSVCTPAIVGNMGNLGDLVIEGVTGFHYTYNSVEDLVKSVENFDNLSREDVDKLSKNARNYYENNLTQAANYQMLKDIYDTVCG